MSRAGETDLLERRALVKEIFDELGRRSNPLQEQSVWAEEALRYLESSVHLYPDGERRRDFDVFVKAASLFSRDGEGAAGKDPYVRGLVAGGIVAGFKILFAGREEYETSIRDFLCEQLKRAFEDPAHLEPRDGQEPALAKIVDALEGIASLDASRFRALAEFVRNLPDKGRDRPSDIRLLARLWHRAAGLEEALARLLDLPGHDAIDLAFDLLQSFRESDDYRNAVLAKLADLCVALCGQKTQDGSGGYSSVPPDRAIRDCRELAAILMKASSGSGLSEEEIKRWLEVFRGHLVSGLRRSSQPMSGSEDWMWLAEALSWVFEDDEPRRACLQSLKDIATVSVIDRNRFREALFRAAESVRPREEATACVFGALYDALNPDGASPAGIGAGAGSPDEIQRLIDKCREFFDQEIFDSTVTKALQRLAKEPEPSLCHGKYIEIILRLATMYGEKDRARRASETMSGYFVLGGKPGMRDYHLVHAKIALKLLRGSTYTKDEALQLIQEIQRFYEEDSLSRSTSSTGVDVDGKAKENAIVCRRVIEMLQA